MNKFSFGNILNINDVRIILSSIAEALDYFRVVPRLIVIAYGYMTYDVVNWFMALQSPSAEQSALIVTVLSVAGAVIGLYQKSGREWDKSPFIPWHDEEKK